MFLLFLDWKQKQKNAFFSQVNSRVFFLSHAWVFDGFKWQLDIFQFLVFQFKKSKNLYYPSYHLLLLCYEYFFIFIFSCSSVITIYNCVFNVNKRFLFIQKLPFYFLACSCLKKSSWITHATSQTTPSYIYVQLDLVTMMMDDPTYEGFKKLFHVFLSSSLYQYLSLSLFCL